MVSTCIFWTCLHAIPHAASLACHKVLRATAAREDEQESTQERAHSWVPASMHSSSSLGMHGSARGPAGARSTLTRAVLAAEQPVPGESLNLDLRQDVCLGQPCRPSVVHRTRITSWTVDRMRPRVPVRHAWTRNKEAGAHAAGSVVKSKARSLWLSSSWFFARNDRHSPFQRANECAYSHTDTRWTFMHTCTHRTDAHTERPAGLRLLLTPHDKRACACARTHARPHATLNATRHDASERARAQRLSGR